MEDGDTLNSEFIEKILKRKDYVFKLELYGLIKEFKLNLEEVLILIYFMNQELPTFNVELISKITNIEVNKILDSFTSLCNKGLINLKVINENGKMLELIDLEYTYKALVSLVEMNTSSTSNKTSNIYEKFEKEFSRTLSPMEYELINDWLNKGINEELITGALKEAVYNNVLNFRYIEKIIYEWNKKGFKTMNDVNNHLKSRSNDVKDVKEIGDFNWLDE